MAQGFICRCALGALPKRVLTKCAGTLLRSRASRWLIPLFARCYHIDLLAAEKPWRDYRSLTEFFARRLRPGLRSSPAAPEVVVSPVDGRVAQVGMVTGGQAVQVKGVAFSVQELLADEQTHRFDGGTYVTIYLSPSDYHRVHAPVGAWVTRTAHIVGTFFPVNGIGTRHIPGLYTKNERIVSWMEQSGYHFAVVKVGSLLVGSVQLVEALHPCAGGAVLNGHRVFLARGDEMAWFEFGSTVILVFGSNQVALSIQEGDEVRALQPIGVWMADGAEAGDPAPASCRIIATKDQ